MAKKPFNKHNLPTGRKAGRPRKVDRPITPEIIEEIGVMWLRGKSVFRITQALRARTPPVLVSQANIYHHLEHTLKPLWRERNRHNVEIELAKVAQLEELCWERFSASQEDQTKETIKSQLLEDGVSTRLLERILATQKRDGDTSWLSIIQWCVDYRSKVGGHYAPERHLINSSEDMLRVAGMTREQVDQQMFSRIAELVAVKLKGGA